jgi:hypothetical protein
MEYISLVADENAVHGWRRTTSWLLRSPTMSRVSLKGIAKLLD